MANSQERQESNNKRQHRHSREDHEKHKRRAAVWNVTKTTHPVEKSVHFVLKVDPMGTQKERARKTKDLKDALSYLKRHPGSPMGASPASSPSPGSSKRDGSPDPDSRRNTNPDYRRHSPDPSGVKFPEPRTYQRNSPDVQSKRVSISPTVPRDSSESPESSESPGTPSTSGSPRKKRKKHKKHSPKFEIYLTDSIEETRRKKLLNEAIDRGEIALGPDGAIIDLAGGAENLAGPDGKPVGDAEKLGVTIGRVSELKKIGKEGVAETPLGRIQNAERMGLDGKPVGTSGKSLGTTGNYPGGAEDTSQTLEEAYRKKKAAERLGPDGRPIETKDGAIKMSIDINQTLGEARKKGADRSRGPDGKLIESPDISYETKVVEEAYKRKKGQVSAEDTGRLLPADNRAYGRGPDGILQPADDKYFERAGIKTDETSQALEEAYRKKAAKIGPDGRPLMGADHEFTEKAQEIQSGRTGEYNEAMALDEAYRKKAGERQRVGPDGRPIGTADKRGLYGPGGQITDEISTAEDAYRRKVGPDGRPIGPSDRRDPYSSDRKFADETMSSEEGYRRKIGPDRRPTETKDKYFDRRPAQVSEDYYRQKEPLRGKVEDIDRELDYRVPEFQPTKSEGVFGSGSTRHSSVRFQRNFVENLDEKSMRQGTPTTGSRRESRDDRHRSPRRTVERLSTTGSGATVIRRKSLKSRKSDAEKYREALYSNSYQAQLRPVLMGPPKPKRERVQDSSRTGSPAGINFETSYKNVEMYSTSAETENPSNRTLYRDHLLGDDRGECPIPKKCSAIIKSFQKLEEQEAAAMKNAKCDQECPYFSHTHCPAQDVGHCPEIPSGHPEKVQQESYPDRTFQENRGNDYQDLPIPPDRHRYCPNSEGYPRQDYETGPYYQESSRLEQTYPSQTPPSPCRALSQFYYPPQTCASKRVDSSQVERYKAGGCHHPEICFSMQSRPDDTFGHYCAKRDKYRKLSPEPGISRRCSPERSKVCYPDPGVSRRCSPQPGKQRNYSLDYSRYRIPEESEYRRMPPERGYPSERSPDRIRPGMVPDEMYIPRTFSPGRSGPIAGRNLISEPGRQKDSPEKQRNNRISLEVPPIINGIPEKPGLKGGNPFDPRIYPYQTDKRFLKVPKFRNPELRPCPVECMGAPIENVSDRPTSKKHSRPRSSSSQRPSTKKCSPDMEHFEGCRCIPKDSPEDIQKQNSPQKISEGKEFPKIVVPKQVSLEKSVSAIGLPERDAPKQVLDFADHYGANKKNLALSETPANNTIKSILENEIVEACIGFGRSTSKYVDHEESRKSSASKKAATQSVGCSVDKKELRKSLDRNKRSKQSICSVASKKSACQSTRLSRTEGNQKKMKDILEDEEKVLYVTPLATIDQESLVEIDEQKDGIGLKKTANVNGSNDWNLEPTPADLKETPRLDTPFPDGTDLKKPADVNGGNDPNLAPPIDFTEQIPKDTSGPETRFQDGTDLKKSPIVDATNVTTIAPHVDFAEETSKTTPELISPSKDGDFLTKERRNSSERSQRQSARSTSSKKSSCQSAMSSNVEGNIPLREKPSKITKGKISDQGTFDEVLLKVTPLDQSHHQPPVEGVDYLNNKKSVQIDEKPDLIDLRKPLEESLAEKSGSLAEEEKTIEVDDREEVNPVEIDQTFKRDQPSRISCSAKGSTSSKKSKAPEEAVKSLVKKAESPPVEDANPIGLEEIPERNREGKSSSKGSISSRKLKVSESLTLEEPSPIATEEVPKGDRPFSQNSLAKCSMSPIKSNTLVEFERNLSLEEIVQMYEAGVIIPTESEIEESVIDTHFYGAESTEKVLNPKPILESKKANAEKVPKGGLVETESNSGGRNEKVMETNINITPSTGKMANSKNILDTKESKEPNAENSAKGKNLDAESRSAGKNEIVETRVNVAPLTEKMSISKNILETKKLDSGSTKANAEISAIGKNIEAESTKVVSSSQNQLVTKRKDLESKDSDAENVPNGSGTIDAESKEGKMSETDALMVITNIVEEILKIDENLTRIVGKIEKFKVATEEDEILPSSSSNWSRSSELVNSALQKMKVPKTERKPLKVVENHKKSEPNRFYNKIGAGSSNGGKLSRKVCKIQKECLLKKQKTANSLEPQKLPKPSPTNRFFPEKQKLPPLPPKMNRKIRRERTLSTPNSKPVQNTSSPRIKNIPKSEKPSSPSKNKVSSKYPEVSTKLKVPHQSGICPLTKFDRKISPSGRPIFKELSSSRKVQFPSRVKLPSSTKSCVDGCINQACTTPIVTIFRSIPRTGEVVMEKIGGERESGTSRKVPGIRTVGLEKIGAVRSKSKKIPSTTEVVVGKIGAEVGRPRNIPETAQVVMEKFGRLNASSRKVPKPNEKIGEEVRKSRNVLETAEVGVVGKISRANEISKKVPQTGEVLLENIGEDASSSRKVNSSIKDWSSYRATLKDPHKGSFHSKERSKEGIPKVNLEDLDKNKIENPEVTKKFPCPTNCKKLEKKIQELPNMELQTKFHCLKECPIFQYCNQKEESKRVKISDILKQKCPCPDQCSIFRPAHNDLLHLKKREAKVRPIQKYQGPFPSKDIDLVECSGTNLRIHHPNRDTSHCSQESKCLAECPGTNLKAPQLNQIHSVDKKALERCPNLDICRDKIDSQLLGHASRSKGHKGVGSNISDGGASGVSG